MEIGPQRFKPFSTPSEVHRKLWPVGTVVHEGPQGATAPLGKESITERMARAINDSRKYVAMRGDAIPMEPKFIYLGYEEAAEYFMTALDARAFMGVEVITVDKPSHLAVGE